jgi:outer membrane protein TolC
VSGAVIQRSAATKDLGGHGARLVATARQRSFAAALLWMTCLLSVAGCKVDPQPDVDAYRRILNDGTAEPQLGSDGALSLRAAVAMANRSSESLAIDGESYVRSVQDRRRAVSAFFPTVDFAPRYNWREKTSGSASDSTGGTSTDNGKSGGVDADLDVIVEGNLTVFDGLRNVNTYWRDVYLVERQRDLLLESQELLIYDVSSVYYQVIRAQEQVKVLERSIGVQDERLRDVRGRAQAGVARPLDVAQTEAQYAATRVTLIEARRQVESARSLLAFLVNRKVESLPLSDGYTPGDVVPPVEQMVETATRERGELAAAERAITAAERDVKVAIGQYYPEVTIDLSGFLYRESVPTARSWESLLQVNFPLFSAGRIDADVRTAWSFFREAQLVASQARRRITRDLEQGYRDLTASRERLAELKIQLNAAAEAFRQADASYRAGRGTNLERVTAQDTQLQAELSLVTEAIDQKLLRLQLLQGAGLLREALLDQVATTGPSTRTTP